MAGASNEESGPGRSFEGVSSGTNQLHRQSSDAMAECRSFEQVENGAPSTSPPYWDIDDDEDGGPKPSELYGKYTWKIDKFSQINKRELRSNAFEVGGYKWYILIYPQGCDVCNHLSLFLCVANHDKLLPGWSHFAQFTIAVVNKDPKKSKYSDTLHRFWKKEHDWGWKKFMELSKVMDGFIDADTLIIKAQVQVIRERADRPFRCLDCQYRRELVRVYLSNVEQICRRFVEDRRTKLGKLIDEKAKWSSFCTFWLGMDQSSRRRMSRERTESILKVAVKHFFVEKEVTSTLVMDSLYSGLKALEGQTKGKKSKGKSVDAEELPNPVIGIEKDAFVLVDDVLLLLERAAMEPLPPKDDKGPQNRTKDGVTGEEISKDSIERDERRLTELGRRTIEIFVLFHIYSKIDVAYQEAVALKRQEELIREEEAAWHAEIEQKPRRGIAEKKSKKKQGKQKKNNRKVKEKGRDEKFSSIVQDSIKEDFEIKDPLSAESEMVIEKIEALEDVSDASDSVDCEPEVLPIDSEDRDTSPVNWDTDNSEVQPPTEASSSGFSVISGRQNGTEGRNPYTVDDSSSTCSSDSVPGVGINVSHTGNHQKNQKNLARGTKHQSKLVSDNWAHEEASQSSEAASGAGPWIDASRSSRTAQTMSQAAAGTVKVNGTDRRVEKDERSGSMQRNLPAKGNTELSPNGTASVTSPPRSPSKSIPFVDPKSDLKANAVSDPVILKKSTSDSPKQGDRSVRVANSAENAASSKPDMSQKLATPKPAAHPVVAVGSEKPSTPPMTSIVSRPSSAPLIIPAAPRPAAVSTAQTAPAPALSRSASATGRLGPEPSVSTSPQSYVPQSYRNAIIGSNATGTSSAYGQSYSMVNASSSYSQTPRPSLYQRNISSDRVDTNPSRQMFSFGMVNQHDGLQNGPHWMDTPQSNSRELPVAASDHSTLLNDMHSLNLYNPAYSRPQNHNPSEFPVATPSGRQNHAFTDEFPHLDIINDLLDDEYVYGNTSGPSMSYTPNMNNGSHHLNRHLTFPGDPVMSSGLGLSAGSCRFERTRTYHDEGGFQHNYGALGTTPYDAPRDMIPQGNPRPYNLNGQMDSMMPNQWQMSTSDMPYMGVMNAAATDNDGYPYHHMPEYANLSVGVNGYTMFRPSSGH